MHAVVYTGTDTCRGLFEEGTYTCALSGLIFTAEAPLATGVCIYICIYIYVASTGTHAFREADAPVLQSEKLLYI